MTDERFAQIERIAEDKDGLSPGTSAELLAECKRLRAEVEECEKVSDEPCPAYMACVHCVSRHEEPSDSWKRLGQ